MSRPARAGISGQITAQVLPKRYASPELVARGGMGEVYRATDSVLGRPVAVKLLSDRYAIEDEARARFRREASAAARLSSAPNVVTVFDVGEHEGRPLIVMEYLDGGSVHDRIRNGRVPREQALQWLEQTARAVDRAHANGVVHRDLKPANLLLDREGNVHVSDFGIASTVDDDTLTLPGTVLGTAGYLAPEQARGEPATPASDRYALGVLAFELLTGRRPYAGDTPTTEAFAHLHAEVPSATAVDPTLPPATDDVFRRALAKDPRDRPATASELVEDLRRAFRDAEPTTAVLARSATAAPPPGPVRTVRRRPVWLLPLALLALIVAGVATAALVANDDAPEAQTVTRERTTVSTVSGTTSTVTVTETTSVPADDETTEPPPDDADGAALNDAGFAEMQAGDFEAALPLLEQAVSALEGSGTLAEAYASYNLAYTRFALGSCDGVLELLDRSESVQGKRSEIDRLRRDAEKTCGDGNRGRGKKND